MDAVDIPSAIEPEEWFVVFHRKAAGRLLSLITIGEFKHVSAFGYCAGFKAWLIYDVKWAGTTLSLVANNDQGRQVIMAWTDDCAVVKIARSGVRMGAAARLGFTCVTAVKHLIGLRCVAARPDALYRHILRNGGVRIDGRRQPGTDTADPG